MTNRELEGLALRWLLLPYRLFGDLYVAIIKATVRS